MRRKRDDDIEADNECIVVKKSHKTPYKQKRKVLSIHTEEELKSYSSS